MNQDGPTGNEGPVPPWGRPSRKPPRRSPHQPAQQPPYQPSSYQPPLGGPVLPPPPAPGRGRAVLIGLLVGLLVVAGGGGVAWLVLGGDDSGGSNAAASSASAERSKESSSAADRSGRGGNRTSSSPSRSTTPRTTQAPPPVDPEAQATSELERLRSVSLQRMVLDGHWVAQVASKAVGITDPMQTTASGSHTFTATDILAENQTARRLADVSSVLTVQSTDFGKVSRWTNGQPFWVTLVDLHFATSEQAQAWCDQAFAGLTQEQRDNTCAPRTLVPPHD